VTFDCWSTLIVSIDGARPHARRVRALEVTASDHGQVAARPDAERALERAWALHFEHWSHGRASDARSIARGALAELGVLEESAVEQVTAGLSDAVQPEDIRALPGARALLERLGEVDVRAALICDTGLTPGVGVRRLLDSVGLLDRLDATIFSDETGLPKPAPEIFAEALAILGVEAEDALHVGDLRRTDVAGARRAGLRTVRIRSAHDDESDHPEADSVVDSHVDLAGLLGLPIEG
jgi:putative hydrolase of the HAD superfamily